MGHLHTTKDSWREKIEAAYFSGCNRFDSAIKGLGGCPMANDDLVGNWPKCIGMLYDSPTALSTSANNGKGKSPIVDLKSFNFS